MSCGLYAYAITKDRPVSLDGPWLIGHQGLALVVADVDLARFTGLEFDEPAEDSPLAVLAREHDSVVRAVFRHSPVLPLRFGTVLDSPDAALRLLTARHEEALARLDQVAGHREWGVRLRAAAREPVELDGLSGTAYLTMRRRNLTAVSDSRRHATAVHEELGRCAAESARRDLAGDVLLDAAYLVDVSREASFHAEVQRLGAELSVEVTGPWPPYSFTRMELADA